MTHEVVALQVTGPGRRSLGSMYTVYWKVPLPVESVLGFAVDRKSQSSPLSGEGLHWRILMVFSGVKPEKETVTICRSANPVLGVTVTEVTAFAGEAEPTVDAASSSTPTSTRRSG